MSMHDQRRQRADANSELGSHEAQPPRAMDSGIYLSVDGAAGGKRESRAQRSRERSWHLRWRVFSSSPIPMLIFMRTTGAIVAANDAAVREYGWTEEELLASSISDLVPATDRFVDRLLRHAHPQTTWTPTLIQHRKDGTTFRADMGMLQAGVTDSATMAVVMKQEAHAVA
jgi:PAS domain S-box-containing protein